MLDKCIICSNTKPQTEERLLEIVSVEGLVLKAFQELELNVIGIDSTRGQEFAVDILQADVFNSFNEDLKTKEKFDVVFLNHVLNYFMKPNEAMIKIVSLFNSVRNLYIRVPDYDSYDRRAYKEKWTAYEYFHASNFSEKVSSIYM